LIKWCCETIHQQGEAGMLIKTILNRIDKHRSFVYDKARLVEEDGRLTLEVDIRPRSNSLPICSKCQKPRKGYDHLPTRRFDFIPIWGISVVFVYAMRRVDCPDCRVVVESVPWAEGKFHMTKIYSWFLASWAKRLSWKETAEAFRTTWQNVYRSVEMAVSWGRAHINLEGITAIGVDEVAWQKGHNYLTVVYQIDDQNHRLLFVSKDRNVKSLLKFFRWFGKERTAALKFVCSDMWKPYLKVIAKKASHALHVLDRFHIVSMMNKAIDKVRSAEAKKLKTNGYEPVLKGTRWCLLKRPENLTDMQKRTLKELLQYNLKVVKSYLLKDLFDDFWGYKSAWWAGQFLDNWCKKVMRSRIDPMKKVAKTLRKHRKLILNWFRAKGTISSGIVEGFNGKLKLTTRKAYGYRSYKIIEIALFHTLANLPQPKFTHEFW